MTRRPSQQLTAAQKGKSRATSRGTSSRTPAVDTDPENPWPRPDGEPFDLSHIGSTLSAPNINVSDLRTYCKFPRELGAPWSEYNSIFYNRWLRISFHPTPIICPETLTKMGIHDEVVDMLARMGLGTLPFKHYKLYKELAIQFFSSIRIHQMDGSDGEDATKYFIAFMLRGIEYRLTIPQLCRLYGFDETATERFFPENEVHYRTALWRRIGDSATSSRDFRITLIRNPVLRVVSKIVGTVFFAREETSALALPDLTLLHYGLPPSAHSAYFPGTLDDVAPTLEVNLGYQLAHTLHLRRTKGLHVSAKGKDDYTGSLLTPIFSAVSFDLRREEYENQVAYFDVPYFTRALILKGDASTYEFTDTRGVLHHVRLPVPGLTAPDSPAALAFAVPQDLLLPPTSRRHRAQAPRRQPPPPSPTYPSAPDPFEIMGERRWDPIPVGTPEAQSVYYRNMESFTERMERGLRWLICGGRTRREWRAPSSRSTPVESQAAVR